MNEECRALLALILIVLGLFAVFPLVGRKQGNKPRLSEWEREMVREAAREEWEQKSEEERTRLRNLFINDREETG